MVFKIICVCVLWTKVASALEGLTSFSLLQDDLTFVFARRLEDVLAAAFDGGLPSLEDSLAHLQSKL